MNARVVRAKLRAGKLEEAVKIYQNSVIPAAKAQKGYKGKLFFINKDDNKSISITLWETKDDMRAGETSEYLDAQFAKFINLFVEPPVTEHYEVSANTVTV
jgi:heme-degrading monooxygenase HmoA